MADFLQLMHNDVLGPTDEDWSAYLGKLRAGGHHEGGSAVGAGLCVRQGAAAPGISSHIGGYILIEARDLDEARSLVAGNPVYEAGGTVEIRELPRSD